MNQQPFEEVISAALDGEAVDTDALKAALGTEDGRRLLASFVQLRAAVAAEVPATPATCEVIRPARWSWVAAGPRIPATIAASVTVLAVAGALFVGGAWRANVAAPTVGSTAAAVPPRGTTPTPIATPAQLSQLNPCTAGGQQSNEPQPAQGGAKSATVKTLVVSGEPPTPARVLKFVPGVDWRTTSGSEQ